MRLRLPRQAQRRPTEQPHPVSVPEVEEQHSVRVLGVADGQLQLQATLSCGSGESLLGYNPASGTSTVLLGGDINGGGVVDAVTYPDSQ